MNSSKPRLFSLLKESVFLFVFFGLLTWFFTYRITYFNFPIYDETFYVESAQAMFKGELDTNKVHPPLAKWLISLPMYAMGDTWSLSWRIAPLVFGLGGLLVLYYFAVRLGLNRWQAALAVLMLVATKSWYILSRVAMLDIFLCFFVLLAACFLYIFLVGNGFRQRGTEYVKWWNYWLFCMISGLAGATKWSGFFPLLFFVVPFWWFYIQESKWWRLRQIFVSIFVSIGVFGVVSVSLLQFNTWEFLSRNGFSIVTHNSSMLPEFNPPEHQARGGFDAFWRYFVFDQGYLLRIDGFQDAKFSNNHLIAVSLAIVILMFLMVFVGKIIRLYQNIEFESPTWFVDKRVIFLLMFSLSSMLPWSIIPRNQYIYYFVPAFPTLVLMIILLLSKRDWKLQGFYYILYFAIFLYGLRLTVPV